MLSIMLYINYFTGAHTRAPTHVLSRSLIHSRIGLNGDGSSTTGLSLYNTHRFLPYYWLISHLLRNGRVNRDGYSQHSQSPSLCQQLF